MRAAGAASAALADSRSAGFEPARAAANGAVGHGPFAAGQPSGHATIGSARYSPVAACDVTITNAGSTPAEVTGFGVVFNPAASVAPDQQTVPATYISARQGCAGLKSRRTPRSGTGNPDPSRAQDSSIPSGGFATCRVVEWTSR